MKRGALHGHRIGKQACGVWFDATDRRQDRVVQVQFHRLAGSDHRRQLVRPRAVVVLVVGLVLLEFPAGVLERLLNAAKRRMRHHQVDVGGQTADRKREILRDVCRPFQQDPRAGVVGQLRRDRVQEIERLLAAEAGFDQAGVEVALHAIGQGGSVDLLEDAGREDPEQARSARERDQSVPVGLVQGGG
jgi:hypothetical protein